MKIVFLITLLFILAATGQAEQIIIGIGQQAPDNQNINRPQRGMTQAQVLQYFGAPTTKQPAKGEPPIETWSYPEFSVYFERNAVIHSVLHQRPSVLGTTNDTNDSDQAKPHDPDQSP